MDKSSSWKIKLAVYSFSILMMGAAGVATGLAPIMAHFEPLGYSTATVQFYLISAPCITVFIMAIVTGKLATMVPVKPLMMIGILLFLVCGTAPFFIHNLLAIFVLRLIFGCGLGLVQSLSPIVIANCFEGDERASVMGVQTTAQMIGCAVMCLLGGIISAIDWKITFCVHLLAVIPLIIVPIFMPNIKKQKEEAGNVKQEKSHLTGKAWYCVVGFFIFFIFGQIYTLYNALIIDSYGIGSPADAGTATTFFCIGGIIMGLIFGKIFVKTRLFSMTIGYLLCAVSSVICAVAANIAMDWIGAIILGAAFGMIMPCVFMRGPATVKGAAIPIVIALLTAAQGLGQTVSPYVCAFVANMFPDSNAGTVSFWFCAIGCVILAVISVFFNKGMHRQMDQAA